MLDTSDGDARFMLHDFGYRGATSEEAAAVGGAAHLLNFSGTDTLPALRLLQEVLRGPPPGMAYSVAASQHSVMTSGGAQAEHEIARAHHRVPSRPDRLARGRLVAITTRSSTPWFQLAQPRHAPRCQARYPVPTPSRHSIAIPSRSSSGP